MKSRSNLLVFLAVGLIFATWLISSCNKDKDDTKAGAAKVFLTQAGSQYLVPNSTGPANHAVDEENGVLTIFLSASHTGEAPLQAYTVQVAANSAATNSFVNAAPGRVALPTAAYTLPTQAAAAAGEKDAKFNLTVNLNVLEMEYPEFANSQIVLVVAISNPSIYELDTELAQAVVIIDGASFLPEEQSEPMIYLTQALATNNVPAASGAELNYDLDEDNKLLKIFLDVTHNGSEPFPAFTVDVEANTALSTAAAAATPNGVVLPADAYQLPAQVSVPQGQKSERFLLTVDLEKLEEDYPEYAENQIVLVVSISNPSIYELDTRFTNATIIIDGETFIEIDDTPPGGMKLGPELIKDGDFSFASLNDNVNWTVLGHIETLQSHWYAIDNGALRYRMYNPDAGENHLTMIRGGFSVSQVLELEADKTYFFDFDIKATGATSHMVQFFATFSPINPATSSPHSDSDRFKREVCIFTATFTAHAGALYGARDVIWKDPDNDENLNIDRIPEFTSIYNVAPGYFPVEDPGVYPNVPTRINRVDKTFTPEHTGTVYLAFFISSSGSAGGANVGNPGTIWIDNVTLKEVLDED